MQAPRHAQAILSIKPQMKTVEAHMDMDRSSLLDRLSMHILQVTKSWVGLGNEARTAVDLVSHSQTGETTSNIQLPLI